MKRIALTLLLAGAAVDGTASAQACPYTLNFSRYDAGCRQGCCGLPYLLPIFLDVSACNLIVVLGASRTCCGYSTTHTLLLVGGRRTRIPVDPPCDLLVVPDAILPTTPHPMMPVYTVGDFYLPMDPNLIGTDFFFQGAVLRFSPASQEVQLSLTSGVRATYT